MKTGLALLIVLAAFLSGRAQTLPNAGTEAGAGPLVSSDLSNQHVTSFAEDAFGQVWISTDRGLNKATIDSYHQYFSTGDSSSLSDNRIHQVYRDSRDRLWVATVNGVCRYNAQDGFDRIPVEGIEGECPNFSKTGKAPSS
ncbi:MAG: two-component regulator propeller domain-containing protein [Bacteroidales bacterium]